MKVKYKKSLSIIISILLHLLLLIGIVPVLKQEKNYLPTMSKGYTVELVQQKPGTQILQTATTVTSAPAGSQDRLVAVKADINFKDYTEELAREAALKAEKAKQAAQKAKEEQAKRLAKQVQEAKAKMAQQKALKAATAAVTLTQAQQGVQKQLAAPNKSLIIRASAPIADNSKPGAGNAVDSSTNGTGQDSGAFDFRIIEYGRQAAYAINQNIVIPNQYRYTHVTYRAFVTLDRNMQFQTMEMIKSTGVKEIDDNIARALQQTVYPPLPPGANWTQFHNIDFTIH